MTDVKPSDLSWLMMCAVRYSLGRSSYAPSCTADMVTTYMGSLTSDERTLMAEEIRRYLDRVPEAGHIRKTWEELATALGAP